MHNVRTARRGAEPLGELNNALQLVLLKCLQSSNALHSAAAAAAAPLQPQLEACSQAAFLPLLLRLCTSSACIHPASCCRQFRRTARPLFTPIAAGPSLLLRSTIHIQLATKLKPCRALRPAAAAAAGGLASCGSCAWPPSTPTCACRPAHAPPPFQCTAPAAPPCRPATQR